MIRIAKAVTGALASLFVLGAFGAASAQTNQPSEPGTPQQGATAKDAQQQEQVDREKTALKDRVKQAIDSSDMNIDALKHMNEKDKATAKKHDDMRKQLTDLRDRLADDMDKIEKAAVNDWKGVRTAVNHDLAATNSELQRVAAITKVQTPRTGAASKQPESK
jgi:predicted  nucleic acid-binding Zn-ribbon protein